MSARIGLLIPSSNTSVEPEFYRALPPDVTLHTARLFLSSISEETIAAMLAELDSQGRLLATADVDVIMLGAVSPGFLKGATYDRELAARIAAATGKRASTTATALLEALRHLKVTRIAIGAPYDKVVSEIASRFLQGNGIEVVATQELGLTQNLEVGRLLPQSAYDMGLKLDCQQAEAIVLPAPTGVPWRSRNSLKRKLANRLFPPRQRLCGRRCACLGGAVRWQRRGVY